MAVGSINSYDGKCPHGTEGYPPHTEIIGKVGCKDGRVWAVCGAHVKEYQRFPETFEIEIYPKEQIMSEDSHYHRCPQCGEPAECQLPIGDSGCGKAKCTTCKPSKSYRKPAQRGYFLCDTGWICECHSINTLEKTTCPECDRPKPTKQGHSPQGELQPQAISLDPDPAEAEAKVYECPCGEEHDNPDAIRICEGKDCQENICFECCLVCKKCNKDICENCGFSCNDCSNSYCNDHVKHCRCCSVNLCASCSEEHGST